MSKFVFGLKKHAIVQCRKNTVYIRPCMAGSCCMENCSFIVCLAGRSICKQNSHHNI